MSSALRFERRRLSSPYCSNATASWFVMKNLSAYSEMLFLPFL